jgi:hypothetical protein
MGKLSVIDYLNGENDKQNLIAFLYELEYG